MSSDGNGSPKRNGKISDRSCKEDNKQIHGDEPSAMTFLTHVLEVQMLQDYCFERLVLENCEERKPRLVSRRLGIFRKSAIPDLSI